MKNILYLLALFALVSSELWAQSTSSASQVVTFGVRRVSFGQGSGTGVTTTAKGGALKVTIGSQSEFQSALQLDGQSAVAASASVSSVSDRGMERKGLVTASVDQVLLSQKRSPVKSASPTKVFVTFTE
jgi:hypothetical protein